MTLPKKLGFEQRHFREISCLQAGEDVKIKIKINTPVSRLMTQRRIVIGDVHGHYETLMSLLEAIAPDGDDSIYFLGDLIDRGPDSAKVVEFVRYHRYSCLRGNHEQMLLDAIGNGQISPPLLQGWLHSGGYHTLISYDHKIPQEHLNWFESLPTYLDLGDIWLVHAGVNPKISLAEQTAEQFCWIREEFHAIRQPYFADKLIITGHTITFTFPGVKPGKLAAGPGWLDIETGVYHQNSGWLTGLDVTHGLVYQVHATRGTHRKIPLKEAVVTIDPSRLRSRGLGQRQMNLEPC